MPSFIGTRRALLGGGAASAYSQKLLALFGSSVVGYWPMWETSGLTAFDISGRGHHGTYSNVALGQSGFADGRTAASFDGITSVLNLFSAGLAADFNGAELTFLIWARLPGGVWSDGLIRRFSWFAADGSNVLSLLKQTVPNVLVPAYVAGGTTKTVVITTAGPTDNFHFGITVSKAGDAMKAYYQGSQSGTTQTGLGTFAGTLAEAVIGSLNATPLQVMFGVLGHAILLNRSATAAEVAIAATP